MSLVIPKASDIKDYYLEVAKGNIDGESQANVQGRNPDVSTGTPEDIWDLGGDFVFPTSVEQWEVLSSDAQDTAGGDGAQEVELTYLDGNYIKQTQIIALNGTTPAPFATVDMFRPVKLVVTSIGVLGANQGLITVRVVGGGDNRIGITEQSNKSLHGLYTVEAGKTAYLVFAYSTIQKNKDANISLFLTDGDDGIFQRALPVEVYQNSLVINLTIPLVIPEKSDIRLKCSTQNNNTDVSAFIQFLLVDNEVQ